MAFLIGIGLAMLVAVFARVVGLDRDRAFYPTVLVVVASYYGLFAVIGGSPSAIVPESAAMLVFLAAVVFGFRRNLWLVVAGLLGHGIFDFFHGQLIANPGVPAWWPMFCLAYDAAAAAILGWLLSRRAIGIRPVH
jgi:hypothetical protein